MKVMSNCVAIVMIVCLAAHNVYLHNKIQTMTETVATLVKSDEQYKRSSLQNAILELKSEFTEFAGELKTFERFTAEKDAELAKAVNKLEDWVETSSVQGKLNGYKRQLGDYEARMAEKYQQVKESLQSKIDAMKIRCQKFKDGWME